MDALRFTAIYIITLLVPFWFVNKGWFYLFAVCGAVIAVFEYSSFKAFGKTLSQRFWDEGDKKKITGIISLVVFFIYLLAHLFFQI